MSAGLHFEVLADCPLCRVEAGVVELYDGRSVLGMLGVAVEARCRMCDAAWEGTTDPVVGASAAPPGRCPACKRPVGPDAAETRRCATCGLQGLLGQSRAPASLATLEAVSARLSAFAAEEGHGSAEELLRQAFLGITITELHERLGHGERIPTSFDVFQFLFGHASAAAPASASPATAPEADGARPTARDSSIGRDPRAILYPIVSIMAADGVIDPAELRFVSAFLESEGQPPLEEQEIRVHRPAEVQRHIPRARRRQIVELMIQLALVDGHPDTSELRLTKAYANAWGITEHELVGLIDRYRDARASSARRFLLKLKSFFFEPAPPPVQTR